MIRHQRGQATACEKWVRSQAVSPACRELLQVIVVYRNALSTLEAELVKFDVSEPEQELRPALSHKGAEFNAS